MRRNIKRNADKFPLENVAKRKLSFRPAHHIRDTGDEFARY
jgi:hypothetical protein